MAVLIGGVGDDIFVVRLGDGVTAVDGVAGADTLSLDWSNALGDVRVSLDSATAIASLDDGSAAGPLVATSIRNLILNTGAGDDSLAVTGSASIVTFNGGGGINRFDGDFTDAVGNISFTLNQTPGAISTFLGQGSTIANVQSVVVHTGSGDDVLVGGAGDDKFDAGAGNDTLYGGAGNDILIGGTGANTMYGGLGDDSFTVFGPGDQVIENPGEGTDSVLATIAYTLPANAENLTELGTQAYAGGNSLNNVISGGAGEQTLDGRGGDDILTGGAGADIFIFQPGSGHDVITDFQSGVDRARLDGLGFSTFAQVMAGMVQRGADVILSDSTSESVVFQNHLVTDFTAQDFMLPLDTTRLKPTFVDDFNTLSLFSKPFNTGTWWTSFGSGGPLINHTLTNNHELQIYVDPLYAGSGLLPLGLNPFSVQNGVLDITARPTTPLQAASLFGYQYTSGLINTKSTFSQLYGYFEARVKLPIGNGLWPAFWLLPSNFAGTPEIDIFEQLGRDPSTIYQAYHSRAPGQPGAVTTATHIDNSDQFHTYGMLWDQNYLVSYIDGMEVARQLTPSDMNKPMYMLLNLAVGGIWPGNPDATTVFPATMSVDYVHAYSLVNAPPTAVADTYAVRADMTLTVGVSTGLIANDQDSNGADANWLQPVLVQGPSHGALILGQNGAFSYTPTAGYVGFDSFSYRASDGLLQSLPVTVSLTIAPNHPPIAASGSGSTLEDTMLSGQLPAASDADGDPVAYGLSTAAAHGMVTISASGAFSYSPQANFNGPDSFGFSVSDGQGGVSVYSYDVNVTPVNDPPNAVDDAVTVGYGAGTVLSTAFLLANDTDVDGDLLTVTGVANAIHGQATLNGGQLTFTPQARYSGPASFDYMISDGHGGTASAHVAVTVAAPAPAAIGFNPPADLIEASSGNSGVATSVVALSPSSQLGPVIYDFKGWTAQGGGIYKQVGVYGIAILNPAANTLTYTLNNSLPTTNGLTTGQVVSETFNVKVSDGVSTATAPVAFHIDGANDNPIGKIDVLTVAYGKSVTVSAASLLANDFDPEGGPLTLTAASGARHGVVTQAANGDITFTPYLGYTGTAYFSYTLTDSTGLQTKVSDQVNVTGTAPNYIYAQLSSVGIPIDVSGDGLPHTVLGSPLNDVINGGAARDILNGDAGDDGINGGGGDDFLTGGPGSDYMYGAAGNDTFVWLLNDVVNTPAGTTDTVYDFAGAGDGRASGDGLLFRGFSPGSTFTFLAAASFNPNLFYYTLTDALSGASQVIGVQSLDGQLLVKGDYLFT